MMRVTIAVALLALLQLHGSDAHELADPGYYTVAVDFSNVTFRSRSTTTLQVVSNPILDRTFTAPNGTEFDNPIHDAAFESLANLHADLVRYVPWFPYPHKSVAELEAPKPTSTSWDFTYISPMLEDFMAAVYGNNHSTVINFSTQPCWLFGDANNKPQNCSFPANPDESFFGYVRGNRANLLDPTSSDLSKYYARLLSWLVKGEFTDENGVVHSGGPKYNLSRANGHVWELFNEAEHGYTWEQYVFDYDRVVPAMIDAVGGGANAPAFMGIGGASPSWVPPFLNKSNHGVSTVPPIDYFSLHHYSSCANRTDPSTYSTGFFGGADAFIQGTMISVLEQRAASSYPNVKIDLDELGVIMPDDNDPNFGIDAELPDIYWNAAGAMYAYIFQQLAPMGVEVLGHSQLAGSPKIPEWGIPLPQYPSVSLLDWRTGYGNARYWALKILIEEFAAGDLFVNTAVSASGACSSGGNSNPFCGEINGPEYGSVTLQCCSDGDTISTVDFADWGTPAGHCGSYSSEKTCTAGAAKVKQWVSDQCLGKHACTLTPYPELGDPCVNVVKRFATQVGCSGINGGIATSAGSTPGVVALGAIATGKGADGHSPKAATNKVLLINTQNVKRSVTVTGFEPGTALSLRIVDPQSVQVASKNDGIRSDTATAGEAFLLQPFAIVVASGAPTS